MKVTVNNTNTNTSKPFPKLMVSEQGNIVLFTEPRIGTCISTSKEGHYIIGEYLEKWNMDSFTDFNGSITLSND